MSLLDFVMPTKIYWDEATKTDTYGKLYVEPLERGFGITIGNALRRVLLSSLPGGAITAVKIMGVPHEFTTIKGVIEDVAEIVLNLKQIRLKIDENIERDFAILEAENVGKVYAKDIKFPAGIELVTPDVHICTISEPTKLQMEFRVERGIGYKTVEELEPISEIGWIIIDTAFSPIKRVAFNVEPTRVGDKTDYDKLILEIETDGTITPDEALTKASNILIDHFNILQKPTVKKVQVIKKTVAPKPEEIKIEEDKLSLSIDELEISSRAINNLRKLGINTIGDLVRLSEEDLKEAKSIGRKSIKEIKDALAEMGLELAPSKSTSQ
ncbi:DNA-directed RNA polymerase subunit alpha [Sulfurihydrogenibium yellowstonense]|uniref:DNA-directed RNA polymerase subunit alpha n=1 Tax=Sulfurihydrogenibium yellowstonense SS-5 TaxID=432331 RepID=C4FJK8_9AQUI|nr:DNA-directed RNA polymerase subunit alpha [Sulfurihydrogenibium yellowstonense]EEP60734.1 DNA-directed RNA polymerase, alpha subunit [Sulfurihydrogenibium yellowstonense SS-5]